MNAEKMSDQSGPPEKPLPPTMPSNPWANSPGGNPYASSAPSYPANPPGYYYLTADQVRRKLAAPAKGLIICNGILLGLSWLGVAIIGVVGLLETFDHNVREDDIVMGVIFVTLGILMPAIAFGPGILAGVQMLRVRRRGLALGLTITGIVLGFLLCYHSVIQVPFCIWALVVLSDWQVKSYFEHRRAERQLPILS